MEGLTQQKELCDGALGIVDGDHHIIDAASQGISPIILQGDRNGAIRQRCVRFFLHLPEGRGENLDLNVRRTVISRRQYADRPAAGRIGEDDRGCDRLGSRRPSRGRRGLGDRLGGSGNREPVKEHRLPVVAAGPRHAEAVGSYRACPEVSQNRISHT